MNPQRLDVIEIHGPGDRLTQRTYGGEEHKQDLPVKHHKILAKDWLPNRISSRQPEHPCPFWDQCSIPVCPLSPAEGKALPRRLLLDEGTQSWSYYPPDPECGDLDSHGKIIGLSAAKRYEVVAGKAPYLTERERTILDHGDTIRLVDSGEQWQPPGDDVDEHQNAQHSSVDEKALNVYRGPRGLPTATPHSDGIPHQDM